MARTPPEVRAWYALRAAYGAAQLLAPPAVLAVVVRSPLDRATVRVARVLGARQLVQSVLLERRPGLGWQLGGAAVDAAHAASMLALGRWGHNRRHRRLAVHDGRMAALLALTGLVAARRCAAARVAGPAHEPDG